LKERVKTSIQCDPDLWKKVGIEAETRGVDKGDVLEESLRAHFDIPAPPSIFDDLSKDQRDLVTRYAALLRSGADRRLLNGIREFIEVAEERLVDAPPKRYRSAT
jgi:hypothetical protein